MSETKLDAQEASFETSEPEEESEVSSRIRTRTGKSVLSRLKLKVATVNALVSCLAVRADESTLDKLISEAMGALGVKSND